MIKETIDTCKLIKTYGKELAGYAEKVEKLSVSTKNLNNALTRLVAAYNNTK